MWEDPIVAEVRKIREEYAAQFGYDLQSLCRVCTGTRTAGSPA